MFGYWYDKSLSWVNGSTDYTDFHEISTDGLIFEFKYAIVSKNIRTNPMKIRAIRTSINPTQTFVL